MMLFECRISEFHTIPRPEPPPITQRAAMLILFLVGAELAVMTDDYVSQFR